jgi:hypothetical protein
MCRSSATADLIGARRGSTCFYLISGYIRRRAGRLQLLVAKHGFGE